MLEVSDNKILMFIKQRYFLIQPSFVIEPCWCKEFTMNISHPDFKVDATALELENQYIVVYNANIPAVLVQDEQDRRQALERIRNLFQADFGARETYFQLTASYMLRNTGTNELRYWSGSFFARGNFPAQLSDFEEFNPATFVQTCLAQTRDVDTRLKWRGHDTLWTFESLNSIIINAQCNVHKQDALLNKRNFVPNASRFERVFLRFAIP